MNQKLDDYKVLHFAAHALLPTDLNCMTESAIVASPPPGAPDARDVFLTASDLQTLKLDANLVILSACNTAGPGGSSGESLSGLARALFFARARSLLVTHWDLDDALGSIVVNLTLNNLLLKTDSSVASAVRLAQMKVLDDAATGKLQAAAAHPFFWAAFAVIGGNGERHVIK